MSRETRTEDGIDLDRSPPTSTPGALPDDDTVSSLLHLAGRRRPAPAWARQRGRVAAHAAWQEKVEQLSARRRRRTVLALAAVWTLVVAGAWFWWRSAETPAPSLGRVVALTGRAEAWSADGDPVALTAGQRIPPGFEIRTTIGRVALKLGDASVRLDHDSRLTLENDSRLVLEQGAVYLDSGDDPASSEKPATGGFQVVTTMGTVEDIGTQFEVRLKDAGLSVKVREGRIRLDTADTSHHAEAGTSLVVLTDGTIERTDLAAYGEAWDWVLAAAPEFELEGRTVLAFLEWVSRETGWELRFVGSDSEAAADALEESVASAIAHGTVAGLTPEKALALVLPPANAGFRIEDGVLIITPAGTDLR